MILGFKETKKILDRYKLPYAPTSLATDKSEAISKGEEIGYPLVAKISSTKHTHKTEIGGVVKEIKNRKELGDAYAKLSKIDSIEGVLIQKKMEGIELVIGAKEDDLFGPVVMFGIGGIFVEIFKDISFRVAPIKKSDAVSMIKEIKGEKLLNGFRGLLPVNKDKIIDVLMKASAMITEEEIREFDFNPLFADEKKIQISDARIVV